MKIHTAEELNAMPSDQTFATSPVGACVLPGLLMAASLVIAWALMNRHLPSVFWPGCILLVLMAWFTLQINLWPTLKASNWVVKLHASQLYLMLRSYRNTHLPDDVPIVVSFNASEIASVGRHVKQISIPISRGRNRRWKETRLEITLNDSVPDEFHSLMKSQPEWSNTWYGRSKNDASQISVHGQTIRILWSGPYTGIVPRIDKAIDILSQHFAVHDDHFVDRIQPSQMADGELDNHILELCQAGNRLDAIRLLRKHRGYSQKDAKRFVDELLGDPASSDEV